MKILFISLLCLFINCQTNIQGDVIQDLGKKKITDSLYIKKIGVGSDRIYILVDENDKMISSGFSTSFTVKNGKSSTIKSNTLFR